MTTLISRRRIVAGVAWAVTAVVVGAAAPALAASVACPTVTFVGVQSFGNFVYVTETITGLPVGDSQLVVTSVVGPGFSTLPDPQTITRLSTGAVNVTIVLNRAANPPAGITLLKFDIVLPGGRRCTGYSVAF